METKNPEDVFKVSYVVGLLESTQNFRMDEEEKNKIIKMSIEKLREFVKEQLDV